MTTKGEETRAAILEHASREAARVGLEGLSIGMLATQLGMSKSGLYAHFASKDELHEQIIATAADQFTDHVIRPALRAPRGEPRLAALFERWLGWVLDARADVGCVFVAASAELDDRPCPARERLVAQQRDWLEFIASVARAAIAEGHFRADLDPAQLAFEAYGVVFSFHQAKRLLGDPKAADRARAAFGRLLADARAR